MTDTAKLRGALESRLIAPQLLPVYEAAKAYLALLESSDIILIRKVDGEWPAESVERVAKAVGEMFLYPDPNREGNWMGPGIQAARLVAVSALDALSDSLAKESS